ncbi:MAG: hypothetical protein IJW28_05385, partial [Clostridia bacterium]|nr:hypothetical protein [Clostridia bacterium]
MGNIFLSIIFIIGIVLMLISIMIEYWFLLPLLLLIVIFANERYKIVFKKNLLKEIGLQNFIIQDKYKLLKSKKSFIDNSNELQQMFQNNNIDNKNVMALYQQCCSSKEYIQIKQRVYFCFSYKDYQEVIDSIKDLYGDCYIICIFDNSFLLYHFNSKHKILLSEYDLSAINLECNKEIITKKVVVSEKTKNDITYYKKYAPNIDDSKIINSYWTYTNADGSRTFRGGLKPENNPLC